jgi:uncharacterized membrane-anchored protein
MKEFGSRLLNRKQWLPSWRLWIPLLIQAAIVAAIPAREVYTYVFGQPIVLQTIPVDPYDPMRGHYQTLNYEISRREYLEMLPGGQALFEQNARNPRFRFYVILEPPIFKKSDPPMPWQPVRVSSDRPKNLPKNYIALQGEAKGWRIVYGLEKYYMPDRHRDRVNDEIVRVQTRQTGNFVVEVKVDDNGNAVPVSLWVGDQNYHF